MRTGEQSDTVIVGKFLGEAPLGQFRYAVRLAMTPFQLLLAAAAYVLFPAFSRISAERGDSTPHSCVRCDGCASSGSPPG